MCSNNTPHQMDKSNDANLTMIIQVCTRIKNDMKFSFYPYILLFSAFFLLLSIIVYTFFPKVLFNNTQRLRLHFTTNMFFAFVILSINQFDYIGDSNMAACKFFGTMSIGTGWGIALISGLTLTLIYMLCCQIILRRMGIWHIQITILKSRPDRVSGFMLLPPL